MVCFVGSNAIMLDGIFTLFSMGTDGPWAHHRLPGYPPSDAPFPIRLRPLRTHRQRHQRRHHSAALPRCPSMQHHLLLAGGREIDLGHTPPHLCRRLHLLLQHPLSHRADVAERVNSELVGGLKGWLVDTLLSATLLIGFLVGRHRARYIPWVTATTRCRRKLKMPPRGTRCWSRCWPCLCHPLFPSGARSATCGRSAHPGKLPQGGMSVPAGGKCPTTCCMGAPAPHASNAAHLPPCAQHPAPWGR